MAQLLMAFCQVIMGFGMQGLKLKQGLKYFQGRRVLLGLVKDRAQLVKRGDIFGFF